MVLQEYRTLCCLAKSLVIFEFTLGHRLVKFFSVARVFKDLLVIEPMLHLFTPGDDSDFVPLSSGFSNFSVCRQHYSLVKNAIAKDYLNRKDKLHVWDKDGKLWLLIDNSFNLEELENVHTKTSKDDNKIVQDDFNSLKERGLSRDFLANCIDDLIKDRAYHAENMRSHVKAIQKLGDEAENLGRVIKELKNQIK